VKGVRAAEETVNLIGVILLAILCLAGWVIVGNLGPLTSLHREDVSEFAATYGFQVTEGNGRYVVGYLVRSMRWRRWGAWIGLIAGIVVAAIRTQTIVTTSSAPLSNGSFASSSSSKNTVALGWLLLTVVGFFVGAIVAEFRGGATATGPRRAAILAPRLRSDFMDESLLRSTYLVAATTVGLLVLALIRGDGRAEYVVLAVAGIAVAAVVEVTTRWVVGRPNPIVEPELTIAMDAVRASVLRRIVRIGLAMAWGLLAWEAASVANAVPHHLRAADVLLALYAGWSCLRTGARLRKKSWVVRRAKAPRT
jgi:hypothetical protein